MIYYAKNYKNRDKLDAFIRVQPVEEDDVLVGTADELSEKSLSEVSIVYGVPCKIV